jgi:hypothetical protein
MVVCDESEETHLRLDLTKISRFHLKTKCKKHFGIICCNVKLIYDALILNWSHKTEV